MATWSVTFLPDNCLVQVEEHHTLLDAAERAGVRLNPLCGGKGTCGRCKAIIKSGEVWAESSMHVSAREREDGYVLACKCWPRGDLVVEVPPESRRSEGTGNAEDDARRYGMTQIRRDMQRYPHAPLARKIFLTLPKPGLDDSIADLERLYRELRRDEEMPNLRMDLATLRQLATTLRAHDWQVTVTLGERGETTEVLRLEGGNTASCHYGVAVDIGTTTVVAHLLDLQTGDILARQGTYNSQIQYGEDVITRIMYAENSERIARIADAVVGDINALIAGLTSAAGIALEDISYVMCAGNTTMTHLLLGVDPACIRREPYTPAFMEAPVLRAAEVGIRIHPHGLLGCVPSVASYVGGDIVAGVLVSGMAHAPELSLLIDMGTNAEIAVGNEEWLVCCAASAGPTFEGGGISCGMRATDGAIERLTIRAGGRPVTCDVIGGGKPRGLCGTGLMDAVAEMLRVGIVERSGNLVQDSSPHIREGEDGLEFLLVTGAETADGRDIVMTQADLANFIRSKGAIYHACECLLELVGLQFADVQHVYISGGFGNHLDVRKGIIIGLLPDLPVERFEFIGNGSLQGAETLLLSRPASREASRQAGLMTYIELSTDPKFMNEYTSALFLPHTDIERFPSVQRELSRAGIAGGVTEMER